MHLDKIIILRKLKAQRNWQLWQLFSLQYWEKWQKETRKQKMHSQEKAQV